jgi:hypothetical protein
VVFREAALMAATHFSPVAMRRAGFYNSQCKANESRALHIQKEHMADKKKPAHEVKLGRIRATVWSNQTQDADVWYNVTVTRRFKDDGGWQDAASFRRDDLPIVAKAADMAYDWIWKQQSALTESDED